MLFYTFGAVVAAFVVVETAPDGVVSFEESGRFVGA